MMMRNTLHPAQITTTIQQQASGSVPQSASKKAKSEFASVEAELSHAKLAHSIQSRGVVMDPFEALSQRIEAQAEFYSGMHSIFYVSQLR